VLTFAREYYLGGLEITVPTEELTVASITQMYTQGPEAEGKRDTLAHLYGLIVLVKELMIARVIQMYIQCREADDKYGMLAKKECP
jgi:hypothetical protein